MTQPFENKIKIVVSVIKHLLLAKSTFSYQCSHVTFSQNLMPTSRTQCFQMKKKHS